MKLISDSVDWKTILAAWGALISTVLLFLRIREDYNNRTRLILSHSLNGVPYLEDKIIVSNLGKNTILIEYYELFWKKRRFFSEELLISSPEGELLNISIPGNSGYTFSFTEENSFHMKSKHRLYLRLHIVGKKRPQTLFVTNN